LPQVAERGVVGHAVPGRPLLAFQVVDGVGVGVGLEEPRRHGEPPRELKDGRPGIILRDLPPAREHSMSPTAGATTRRYLSKKFEPTDWTAISNQFDSLER